MQWEIRDRPLSEVQGYILGITVDFIFEKLQLTIYQIYQKDLESFETTP